MNNDIMIKIGDESGRIEPIIKIISPWRITIKEINGRRIMI
jgi:hypothetical protein